jgi:hypothetical protein
MMKNAKKYFISIVFCFCIAGVKSQNDITNSPFCDTLYQAHIEGTVKNFYFDNFSDTNKIIWDSLQKVNLFSEKHKYFLNKLLQNLHEDSDTNANYCEKDTSIKYIDIGNYKGKKRYLVKGCIARRIFSESLIGRSRFDFEIIEYDCNKTKQIRISDSLDFMENTCLYFTKDEKSKRGLRTGDIDTMYLQNGNIKIFVDYSSWTTSRPHFYKKEVSVLNDRYYSKIIEYEGIPISLIDEVVTIYNTTLDKAEIISLRLFESNLITHKTKKGTLYFFSFGILFGSNNPFPNSKVNYYSVGYGIYNVLMFYDGKKYKLLGQNLGKEGDDVEFRNKFGRKYPNIKVIGKESVIYKFKKGMYQPKKLWLQKD